MGQRLAARVSKAIVLGAGPGFAAGGERSHPTAVHEVRSGRRTLDYLITAFESCGINEIVFVGGYGLDQVMRLYPSLHYYYNPKWQETGPVYSLSLSGNTLNGQVLISYADVLFSSSTVQRLIASEAEVAVLVDTNWVDRYDGRGPHLLEQAEKVVSVGSRVKFTGRRACADINVTGQFAGLMKLSAKGALLVNNLLQDCAERHRDRPFHEASVFARAGITDLLQELVERNVNVVSVPIEDQWAELDAPQDVARFIFGTKAETLGRLQPLLRKSTVLDQVSFTQGEWKRNKSALLARIQEEFGSQSLIVRSSALNEDGWYSSNAGRYCSFVGIEGAGEIADAIQRVFQSYSDETREHQCLVQPALKAVLMAGVVFTRDPESAAPYYIISYECTGAANGVTSGSAVATHTTIIYRNTCNPIEHPRIALLLESIREIEDVVGYDSLDIEFAVTHGEVVNVLQVRPLVANRKVNVIADEDIAEEIRLVGEHVHALTSPSDLLLGSRSVLGTMPDWNPAEIIGRTPRPLALSLYQYLITDEIWGIQRSQYGYRDTFPSPLVLGLGGQGYVDTRASFNSFVPADLPVGIAEKLISYYLDRLADSPELHDKVEFEIAFTCFSLDFDERSRRLEDAGFTPNEINTVRESLRRLTRSALERADSFLDEQLGAITALRLRRSGRLHGDSVPSVFGQIRRLLEDCRRYGTLPFAHLARSAFVATDILRSLVRLQAIGEADYHNYLASVQTIASEFALDLQILRAGELSLAKFLSRYGHLRPGTYDVLSPRYDEAPNLYFPFNEGHGLGADANLRGASNSFSFKPERKKDINALLARHGMGVDVEQLDRFVRRSIQGREYAKFEFTWEVSEALRLLTIAGKQLGFGLEEISFVPIQDWVRLATNSVSCAVNHELHDIVERNRARYNVTQALKFPDLILKPEDLESFVLEQAMPNFITNKRVTGQLFQLDSTYTGKDISNLIVHIPNADPGYDWIFGRDIAGLLTTYGGSNSHMAIRAAEFGLPAAIGCGESLARQWRTGMVIELSCLTKQINVVH